MSGETYDYLFKLLLVGDSGVGQSTQALNSEPACRTSQDFTHKRCCAVLCVRQDVTTAELHKWRLQRLLASHCRSAAPLSSTLPLSPVRLSNSYTHTDLIRCSPLLLQVST